MAMAAGTTMPQRLAGQGRPHGGAPGSRQPSRGRLRAVQAPERPGEALKQLQLQLHLGCGADVRPELLLACRPCSRARACLTACGGPSARQSPQVTPTWSSCRWQRRQRSSPAGRLSRALTGPAAAGRWPRWTTASCWALAPTWRQTTRALQTRRTSGGARRSPSSRPSTECATPQPRSRRPAVAELARDAQGPADPPPGVQPGGGARVAARAGRAAGAVPHACLQGVPAGLARAGPVAGGHPPA